MSAIRCKIIICGQESNRVSDSALALVDEIEKDECLSQDVIKCQEKYSKEMKKILKRLTDE